jgi:hypothetical protein
MPVLAKWKWIRWKQLKFHSTNVSRIVFPANNSIHSWILRRTSFFPGTYSSVQMALSHALTKHFAFLKAQCLQYVESSWNVMAHGDAREGKWRGNWRMEWIASTLHTTSELGVSSIATTDAHNLAASSRLNWRPWRFKWFRRKTKSGFCAPAITFQTQSTLKDSAAVIILNRLNHLCFIYCTSFYVYNLVNRTNLVRNFS